MLIESAQEAIFVAVEMEKSAVGLYERALALMDAQGRRQEPIYKELEAMLGDERRHFEQFSALLTPMDAQDEQALLLRAQAADVLFPGGLMGAARQGLFSSAEKLLAFAIKSEEQAAAQYRAFARDCGDAMAQAALRSIAEEEDAHLCMLLIRQSAAKGEGSIK